jgi:hypothetical protein
MHSSNRVVGSCTCRVLTPLAASAYVFRFQNRLGEKVEPCYHDEAWAKCTIALSLPLATQVPMRIALVASRRIEEGEELLYDFACFNSAGKIEGLVACHCGTAKCRSWVF